MADDTLGIPLLGPLRDVANSTLGGFNAAPSLTAREVAISVKSPVPASLQVTLPQTPYFGSVVRNCTPEATDKCALKRMRIGRERGYSH
jgi:hypothetical protein